MKLLNMTIPLLAVVTGFAADPPAAEKLDAQAAFARLQSLVGEWQADTSMGKARLVYEVIAGGSVLVERESFEHMAPMMTVYHLDRDRLILTHYCTTGNQPRMQARSFDPKTGQLRFDFLDATNLASPTAGHMHAVALRLSSARELSADWEFQEGGARKNTESFRYTRVR
jgi:hypothetical protein